MASAAAAMAPEATSNSVPWSRWFFCNTSFDLALVPSRPGIFSVAEEVIVDPAVNETLRALNIIHIGEAEDLFRALNQLFSPNCELRKQIRGRMFLRYGVVPDPALRRRAHTALTTWIEQDRVDDHGIVADFGRYQPSSLNHGI